MTDVNPAPVKNTAVVNLVPVVDKNGNTVNEYGHIYVTFMSYEYYAAYANYYHVTDNYGKASDKKAYAHLFQFSNQYSKGHDEPYGEEFGFKPHAYLLPSFEVIQHAAGYGKAVKKSLNNALAKKGKYGDATETVKFLFKKFNVTEALVDQVEVAPSVALIMIQKFDESLAGIKQES